MPLKLERKLKRQAAADPDIKDKDAYVYGTLRKTGWKPGREKRKEKKMSDSSRVIRLAEINRKLEFAIGGWDVRREQELVDPRGRVVGAQYKSEPAPGAGAFLSRHAGKIALPATGAISGAALGHYGWGLPEKIAGRTGIGRKAGLIGAGVGGLFMLPAGIQADKIRRYQSVYSQVAPLAREDYLRAHGIRRRPAEMSSKDKTIEFDASILGQFGSYSGGEHTSKIDQLEFPAGLSPAAALRMPLPQLMAFIGQRNILQTQFSKKERLIRLSAKLDEIHAAHPLK